MVEKKISKQKAGSGSTQVTANNIIINKGLSENEVRDIIRSEANRILAEANESARQVANARMDTFSSVLVERLMRSSCLDAFRDPAMFFLLKKVQEVAICTDDKTDYDILSELIVYRAEHPNDKDTAAAIKKAISEMDNISEDALNAITIAFSIISFTPISGIIEDGLNAIDTLFAKMLNKITLPNNTDWVDNLEIAGAVRINQIGHLKTYEEIVQANFSGYFVLGLKKDSEDFEKAKDFLTKSSIPIGILVDNPLHDDYVRIAIPSLDKLDDYGLINPGTGQLNKFTTKQKESLKKVINLYAKSGEDYEKMKNNFNSLLISHKNIIAIKEWWDEISKSKISFSITSVGRVLANTNARRIDPNLPDLNNRSSLQSE